MTHKESSVSFGVTRDLVDYILVSRKMTSSCGFRCPCRVVWCGVVPFRVVVVSCLFLVLVGGAATQLTLPRIQVCACAHVCVCAGLRVCGFACMWMSGCARVCVCS